MENKSALIVGATGLVGKQILKVLLENDYYDQIMIIGRRSVGIEDGRIKELIFEFKEFEKYKMQVSANDYYCSVGTTMKKAGSKEAFMKVDYSIPLMLAEHAKQDSNFEQFLMVSSYGANTDSALFYNKVKGKTEDALRALNLKTLLIFQPSLLLGDRDEFRFFEEVAKLISSVFSFFIIGTRLRLWAIKASDVAKAMFLVAKSKEDEGVHVYKPLKMIRIANIE
ncbi:NAD-dependent epimerase/dehydratase family protein [Reichenbachiella sp. MALMAid0571]|uniref:NAD-dependent epimerase/dehydratase family protein n=1 Tax=Reichenbachiella sp. MALMAid0571 TaxID=3143939 RepID=UPI0032DEFDA9